MSPISASEIRWPTNGWSIIAREQIPGLRVYLSSKVASPAIALIYSIIGRYGGRESKDYVSSPIICIICNQGTNADICMQCPSSVGSHSYFILLQKLDNQAKPSAIDVSISRFLNVSGFHGRYCRCFPAVRLLVFLVEPPRIHVPRLYFTSFRAFCPHDSSPKELTNDLKAVFAPPKRISK